MKKILLTSILACGVAVAGETNAKSSMAQSGAQKFAKCVGCHGAKAERKALGKSDVIAGWDVAKTEEALKAYKAGTKNDQGMGGIMKAQVASYSDADIKAVAEYIHSLK